LPRGFVHHREGDREARDRFAAVNHERFNRGAPFAVGEDPNFGPCGRDAPRLVVAQLADEATAAFSFFFSA
jgi:hypothetical protein